MKKLLFVVALLASAMMFAQNGNAKGKGKGKGNAANAQAKKNMSPEERADKITGRLKSEMGLSDDQMPKVKEITLARTKKMAELRAKYANSQDKTAFKAERKAIFESWQSDLKSSVNPDQYAKYEAKKAERMKKLEERKKNAGKKAESASKEGEETLEELEEEVGQ
ncbi:MAG: hypothetical protein MUF42_01105 [Cytophagaceae bacterium]|jgi:hypothetical protein|nr:hypothetical protein [Cytophagaceae bacterium]